MVRKSANLPLGWAPSWWLRVRASSIRPLSQATDKFIGSQPEGQDGTPAKHQLLATYFSFYGLVIAAMRPIWGAQAFFSQGGPAVSMASRLSTMKAGMMQLSCRLS